jgi:TATA-box binding protein (TBP) (component of TFIID and TFIIIB)
MVSFPRRIEVVNVVATATLDHPVDLESLHELFPHEVIYHREIYGGRVAYFKSRDMKGKVSIFRSGKMISVGTRSEEEAGRELLSVANVLSREGIAKLKSKPEIRNVVMIADLGFKPDLEATLKAIYVVEGAKIIYEPEQFPGMIIRLPECSRATILLFSSGKMVCAGLKNQMEIHPLLTTLIGLARGKDQLRPKS